MIWSKTLSSIASARLEQRQCVYQHSLIWDQLSRLLQLSQSGSSCNALLQDRFALELDSRGQYRKLIVSRICSPWRFARD
jgi:hypothetical protein